MGFKEKVAKCIVELGKEQTINEMAAGIATKSAEMFDKQAKEMLKQLKNNMLGFMDEVKKAEDRIDKKYNDIMDTLEKSKW